MKLIVWEMEVGTHQVFQDVSTVRVILQIFLLTPILAINCHNEPLLAPNGGTRAWSGSFRYGETVTYTCGNHAKFVDGDIIKTSSCQWNKTWSILEHVPCQGDKFVSCLLIKTMFQLLIVELHTHLLKKIYWFLIKKKVQQLNSNQVRSMSIYQLSKRY